MQVVNSVVRKRESKKICLFHKSQKDLFEVLSKPESKMQKVDPQDRSETVLKKEENHYFQTGPGCT